MIYERSCACLAENLRAAAAMGAAGLVVHVGSHLGAGLDARLDAVAAGLLAALEEADCRILLENTAGAGGSIGRSFKELARVIDTAGGHPRLGVCLDTQHAWAAGISFETVERPTTWSTTSTAPSASTAWPACTSTTPRSPGAPASTATRTWAGGR